MGRLWDVLRSSARILPEPVSGRRTSQRPSCARQLKLDLLLFSSGLGREGNRQVGR